MVLPHARQCPISAESSVDLPAPGGPVMPMMRREGARERGRAFAVVGMRALEQVEDGGRCREIARAQARGEISARAFVRRASLM